VRADYTHFTFRHNANWEKNNILASLMHAEDLMADIHLRAQGTPRLINAICDNMLLSAFADEKRVACSKCHLVDGRGTKAGPDLAAVGDQYARRDLIEAVLVPSATIAVGYGTTVVETKSGEEYQGVLKQVTETAIELVGADGQPIRIATGDIKEQRGSSVSLMPEGLQAGLSLQEFTDLIEYLVELHHHPRPMREMFAGHLWDVRSPTVLLHTTMNKQRKEVRLRTPAARLLPERAGSPRSQGNTVTRRAKSCTLGSRTVQCSACEP
jgi:putative heme-binding domain-containing protein